MLELIEANDWNRRLKTTSAKASIIPIFHYWNCVHNPERNYIVAIDRFWRDQIMGILTYKTELSDKEVEIITI